MASAAKPQAPGAESCVSPAAMASYFDEHDCEPLVPEHEARTNMLLELARWVRVAGRWGPSSRSSGWGWLGKADDLGAAYYGRTYESEDHWVKAVEAGKKPCQDGGTRQRLLGPLNCISNSSVGENRNSGSR